MVRLVIAVVAWHLVMLGLAAMGLAITKLIVTTFQLGHGNGIAYFAWWWAISPLIAAALAFVSLSILTVDGWKKFGSLEGQAIGLVVSTDTIPLAEAWKMRAALLFTAMFLAEFFWIG